MRSFALYLRKGGDGKTSLTGNLGWYLSQNFKVCLVDCDTQANLSNWLAHDKGEFELADVLFKKEGATVANALVEIKPNLSMLVTATEGSDLGNYIDGQLNAKPFVFKKIVEQIEQLGFDIVFFDLPPNFDKLHRSVIFAVDEVIAPAQPNFFSTEGLKAVTADVEEVNEGFNTNTVVNTIILNRINLSFGHHKYNLAESAKLKEQGFTILHVPQDINIEKSQMDLKTIFDYDSSSRSIDFLKIIGDVVKTKVGKFENEKIENY